MSDRSVTNDLMPLKVIVVLVLTVPMLLSAMPPHHRDDGPNSCIVGRALEHPKSLRNSTIETCAILIQFSDNLADTINHSPAGYDSMFYSTGVYQGQYRAGSLNDFFLENSYGTTDVKGAIAGNQWHMSINPYSYYYDGYYMLSTGHQLATDAVTLVDASVDFSQYDLNNDGHIDGIFIVHAGPGAEDSGDLNNCWSHAIPYFNYPTNDGVTIDGATNVPEINLVTPSLDTTLCCIGVMCHELGHIVGLPDLYDGSRDTWGVGYWSLMGYGAWGAGGNTPWSPSHADAWCKSATNWLTPIDITNNTFDLEILDAETYPVAYRVWRNGMANDTFFILENRQNKGFDAPLPGSGLLVWHIDPHYSAYHNRVDLEEADGCDDLDNGWGYRPDPHYYHHELGDPGDPYPGDSNSIIFDSLSYPTSTDYWGHPTHVSVKNIVITGDTVICDIIIDPLAIAESQTTIEITQLNISPNPFTTITDIRYQITDNGITNSKADVNLRIYDASGRLMKDFGRLSTIGYQSSVKWCGDDDDDRKLPPGVYFIALSIDSHIETQKLLLIR